jgi:hypothetical protein
MNLREVEWHLSQDRGQRWELTKTAMNLQVA